jgi:uncharacterized protein (TIGR00297 family)
VGAAGIVALLARRSGSLSRGGAFAAWGVGAVAVAAGWGWGALLVAWFTVSSWLTHLGASAKHRRSESALAASAPRTSRQVLANGAIFALGAAAYALTGDRLWGLAASGALAAAAADTWATELGLLWGGTPRAILTGRPLDAGLSGGVTAVGLLASVAGGLAVGVGAAPLLGGDLRLAPLLALAGFAGALGDSLLGATLQVRRWCAACARRTEREVHSCGAPTVSQGGVAWMTNDTVNLLCTLLGASAAVALAGPRL